MKCPGHVWVEQSRKSYRPLDLDATVSASQELLKMVMFGLTVIEDRCSRCNELRVTERAGVDS